MYCLIMASYVRNNLSIVYHGAVLTQGRALRSQHSWLSMGSSDLTMSGGLNFLKLARNYGKLDAIAGKLQQ